MSDFEKIKITDIKPAHYNPRIINDENLEKLRQSLNTYGLVDPIIINLKNHNTIIGGHQRYKVLIEDPTIQDLYLIRLGDIGWAFDNLNLKVEDENIEKLLNINLNQDNLMGEWDNTKLESIFTTLELDDIDLELTGFEEWEIDEVSLSTTGTIFDTTEEMNKPIADPTNTPREPPIQQQKEENKEKTTEQEQSNKNDDEDYEIPAEEPTLDESIADNIETIKCPQCGYEIPKNI